MFLALRRRLLVSYLLVIATTLSIFAVAIYAFFARSLYRQLDDGLITQAKAAAPSLAIARKEFSESLTGESSLQDLLKREQSLEWFNTEHQLLAKEGANFPATPLGNQLNAIQQYKQIRSVFISVYGDMGTSRRQLRLEGYVRVSQSTVALEATLAQLQWGMGLGGIIALVLSGIGGVWLTRQSMQPVEQSFQQLQQFTADASHELRSPLTAIKTSIEVMQNHPERVHPQDVKKITFVLSGINQMNNLIEDLLFLARTDVITAREMQSRSRLPLDEVLREIVEILETQIEAKNITFNYKLLSGITVIGNASELTRIFSNLLENALQYTPKNGAVTLNTSSFDRLVVVSIADTGIGIAPEHLSLVFNRFWRADKARSYRNSGTGLGLAIAQSIAHSHGGEITVSSQLGVGSCFQVRLPVV